MRYGLDLFIQVSATCPVRLTEAEETGPDVRGVLKDIPHIVKQHKPQAVSHIRQPRTGHAQFCAVDDRARAADGKSCQRIAWTCSVDAETAMRLSSACVKAFRQWNQVVGRSSIRVLCGYTRAPRDYPGIYLAELVIA